MFNHGEGNGKPLLQECYFVHPEGSPGILQTGRTSSSSSSSSSSSFPYTKSHNSFDGQYNSTVTVVELKITTYCDAMIHLGGVGRSLSVCRNPGPVERFSLKFNNTIIVKRYI